MCVCVCVQEMVIVFFGSAVCCFLLWFYCSCCCCHCFTALLFAGFSFSFTLNNLFICIGGLCYSHVHSFIHSFRNCVCGGIKERKKRSALSVARLAIKYLN